MRAPCFVPSHLVAGVALAALAAGCSTGSSDVASGASGGKGGAGGATGADAGRSAASDASTDAAAASASCTDGKKDGAEGDVDCGGSCQLRCGDGKTCATAGDCLDSVCGADHTCAAPTCSDGVKNGSEGDVDCGGSCATRCAAGEGCGMDDDCTTACDYSGHCAVAPSCTQHHGGDTCGPGPDGDPNGIFESCCTSLPLEGGDSPELDKYVITAGRMRAFVDALGGDVRSFTEAIPADNPWWDHAWDAYMPSTPDEVDLELGAYPAPLSPDPVPASQTSKGNFNSFGQWREGCAMGSGGARTWWSAGTLATDTAPMNYDQDTLDEKMLNCVDAYFTTALCIYDGGHLATTGDMEAAWGAGPYPWSERLADYDDPFDYFGTFQLADASGTPYPDCATDVYPASANTGNPACHNPHWGYPFLFDGATYTATMDFSGYTDKVVHEFGEQFDGPFTYTWPATPAANGQTDNSVHIAPPGRVPNGANKFGHMDLAGMTFEQSAILPLPPQMGAAPPFAVPQESMGVLQKGSWENHAIEYGSGTQIMNAQSNGPWWAYWAMDGRCAHDAPAAQKRRGTGARR